MINSSKISNYSATLRDLAVFRGAMGARTFIAAAIFLEFCAYLMDLYLLRYENDFATYTLALNNPGFMAIYLYSFACIIAARLRHMGINPRLCYFWVWALLMLRFGLRMCIVLPFGAVYSAISLLLVPLLAKEKLL